MDPYIIGIILYLAALTAVGIYKSRAVKTQDDFMVAGRKTTALFLAGTLVCTWVGSGSLFGGAGLAFRGGISQLWMSAGAWVGIAFVYFLADRVRKISKYTISDILEQRYNSLARIFGTSAVIIAYLTIAGYQFRGGGRLLNILTGMDPQMGAAVTCVATILFTIIAGMVSIIAMDLANGIMIIVGVFIALPLAYGAVGGSEALATLPADRFAVFGPEDSVWAMGVFFPTFFLLMGESSMYQKFFAAKDGKTAKKAVIGMIIGVIVVETSLALLSVVGSAKYLTLAPFANPDGTLDKAATETIILYLARHDLPIFAGVLLICAGVAIILSTANTFLMVSSTNVARDIYQRFINPGVSEQAIVKFQRMWIAILGIVAFMAFTAYTMVGAGITPALLAAFLWKRVTVQGGVASIIAGMGVTVVITVANIVMPQHLMDTDYIILPAAAASILCLVGVSLATEPSPEEKWKPFVKEASESIS
ncbi:MAG: solute:Na+ symporter, SSS family/sodium/proline symporter [Bacteroidetes bacterium]|nr:solute:Na+ symporter, SSS family/sodium/proline symporter [Bacteroidota bacterium]